METRLLNREEFLSLNWRIFLNCLHISLKFCWSKVLSVIVRDWLVDCRCGRVSRVASGYVGPLFLEVIQWGPYSCWDLGQIVTGVILVPTLWLWEWRPGVNLPNIVGTIFVAIISLVSVIKFIVEARVALGWDPRNSQRCLKSVQSPLKLITERICCATPDEIIVSQSDI